MEPGRVSRLRILADDLTGALDTAACLVPLVGRIPTLWSPPRTELPWPAAIDAGTRELAAEAARTATKQLASVLDCAQPAFKKLDSLLRGHPAIEIAACARRFDHCVIAPAFPYQGRTTRGGRLLRRTGSGWEEGIDLGQALHEERVTAALCRPGEDASGGVSLWDAESNTDLDAVVAAGRRLSGRVLWCGSGGLASALAGQGPVPRPLLPPPILALIGSQHPNSIAQLSAAWAHVCRITSGNAEEAAPIARRLARANAAVAVVVPPGSARLTASNHIDSCLLSLLKMLDRPGTLFVSGGETLRSVCQGLGARDLEVDGQLVPGVPTSILRGGRWDGLRIVSKSGAFGDAGFLARLLAPREGGGSA